VKFTQVHWLGKELHTTVVTQKFAKITILLLQCSLRAGSGQCTHLKSAIYSMYLHSCGRCVCHIIIMFTTANYSSKAYSCWSLHCRN